jgi:multidrug efflux pump subunit AcrA (membrane-fusion protein)
MSSLIPVRWLPLVLLLPAGAVSIDCHQSQSAVQTVSAAQSDLPVAPVILPQRSALSNQLEVAGELLPYQEVELHAMVSGYIRHIYVDIGDRVRKGQVLADLEIPELVAQVDAAQSGVLRSQEDMLSAKSAVVRAEADHTALHAAYVRLTQAAAARPGLIAQQELDDAQAKDQSSEAQIEVTKANLSAMQQALGVAKAIFSIILPWPLMRISSRHTAAWSPGATPIQARWCKPVHRAPRRNLSSSWLKPMFCASAFLFPKCWPATRA